MIWYMQEFARWVLSSSKSEHSTLDDQCPGNRLVTVPIKTDF
jgi:hypothetical protein